jgi:methionyl-tRNA formyltransferase
VRIVFAGTPVFAERALAALLAAGYEIVLVLTQPDRPAGRGLRAMQSAVKQLAARRGIPVFQPVNLREAASAQVIRSACPDALVVAAYGLIFPEEGLQIALLGALNIHASLLPRWRGAAPIQRALLAGDRETGVSIMRMDRGLDTGPVMARRAVAIADDETASTLHDKLAALGAEMIVDALRELAAGRAVFTPQPAEGVTHAPKIGKQEAQIDWRRASTELARAVRAFDPAPGACTSLAGTPLKVWRARPAHGEGAPGEVLRADALGILVACGEGALEMIELQRAGGRRLDAAEFLRGCAIAPGTRLGSA